MMIKHINHIACVLSVCCSIMASITSCADTDMEQLTGIEEPASLVQRDYLNDYGVLRSYDDKVGIVMDAETFLAKGMDFRIAVDNFAQLVPGTTFSHNQVVRASGVIDTASIASVGKLAVQHDMKLVGGPLISHQGQNVSYLNAQLAPNVVRPDGDDGGYSLKITNSTPVTAADAQVVYTFSRTPQVEPGIKYKLAMMIRGTADGTVQVSTYSNGRGSRFTPNVTVSTQWQRVELTNTMASGIKGLTSILFSIGQYVGTLYIDNIELYEIDSRGNEVTDNLNTLNSGLDDAELTAAAIAVQTNSSGSIEMAGISELGEGYDPLATYIEKTDEEKRQILTTEMQRYISSVMLTGGDFVQDWIVVSQPLAEDAGSAADFFWQNYLGADYALVAFQEAARHSNAHLYIGAGALISAPAAQRLADYVAHLEQAGAPIDGIAVDIHARASETTDYAAIFQVLAATGKIIKLTDVQVLADGTFTEEQQNALLAKILNEYNDKVSLSQQGGVVWHQLLDGDELLGLWSSDFCRKFAYGILADGLKK